MRAMDATTYLVPAAEAAFIAGLSDRQIQRALDENILVAPLVQHGTSRRFARLAAPLARFYFDLDEVLTAAARRQVIATLTQRVQARPDRDAIFGLTAPLATVDWTVDLASLHIELERFVRGAQEQVTRIAAAHRLIAVDAETMGGAPVFAGTRVPAEMVVAARRAGASAAQLAEAYPGVTPEMIDAAEVYLAVHPRRGRPPQLGELNPAWRLKNTKVVRPAAAGR